MRLITTLAAFVFISSPASAEPTTVPAEVSPGTDAPLIEPYLFKGDLAGALSAAEKALKADKASDNLRFQLGTVQFLRGIERLMQSLYANGLRDHGRILPMIRLPRLPIDENPSPRVVSYQDARKMIQAWLDDLTKVDATLEPIRSLDVKMPLHFAMIRLDFNGDGKAEENETLWRVFAATTGTTVESEYVQQMLICFDTADAVWVRGYCHLLSAMCEIALAHDFQELFERAGNILFKKIETPHDCLKSGLYLWNVAPGRDGVDIMDAIAFVHCFNFPVREPDRMKAALEHLRTMVKLSRRTWDLIEEEKDNDHEWLPGPKNNQLSVVGGTMSAERLAAWRGFLDDMDAVLSGKTLLPHPRLPADRGINLRRVFTEPRNLDLVLWVQGTAATPYVEKGHVAKGESWGRLEAIFEGRFTYYALWFN